MKVKELIDKLTKCASYAPDAEVFMGAYPMDNIKINSVKLELLCKKDSETNCIVLSSQE